MSAVEHFFTRLRSICISFSCDSYSLPIFLSGCWSFPSLLASVSLWPISVFGRAQSCGLRQTRAFKWGLESEMDDEVGPFSWVWPLLPLRQLESLSLVVSGLTPAVLLQSWQQSDSGRQWVPAGVLNTWGWIGLGGGRERDWGSRGWEEERSMGMGHWVLAFSRFTGKKDGSHTEKFQIHCVWEVRKNRIHLFLSSMSVPFSVRCSICLFQPQLKFI